jgi:hypothetical protein
MVLLAMTSPGSSAIVKNTAECQAKLLGVTWMSGDGYAIISAGRK